MKLFISWSGQRSEALAKSLRDWLPLVLHYIEPWLSQSDINAGDRWGLEVAKELDESTFGVTCITSDNANAPWLLFEAGALAKSMQEGRVVPLLLDIDFQDISGPLAQFQAKKIDKAGIWDTLCAINKVAPSPVLDGRMKALFEPLWPDLEKQIAGIPKGSKADKPNRPQGEILEELVASVRALDSRYRDAFDEEAPTRRRGGSKFRSIMSDEIIHRFLSDPGEPSGVLMLGSIFRDDYPWIYEICLELYRSMSSRDLEAISRAQQSLVRAAEMLRRGPYLEGSGVDRRAIHFLISEIGQLPDLAAHVAFGGAPTKSKSIPKPPPAPV